MMHYRSVEDLNRYIVDNLHKIPADTDLIVGVPRSGLLAANLLALQLNLPFTDVEGFINGRLIQSGVRMKAYMKPFKDYKKVVIIEDSIWSGKSINEVKVKLKGIHQEKEILYAAVFAGPDATDKVNIYFDICPGPRIFEWNLMHHNLLENCCVEMEGVICKSPTEEQMNDEPAYEQYLSTSEPLLRPTTTIGYLVTSGQERYRVLTEKWLAKHNIKYHKLIMSGEPDRDIGSKSHYNANFKASVYTNHNGWLFIANSEEEAKYIADKAGKPVYCMKKRKMISPNILGQSKRRLRVLTKQVSTFVKIFF